MAFGSTPTSLPFARASIAAGGVSLLAGPAGWAIGAAALGSYALFKVCDKNHKELLQLEMSEGDNSGGGDPNDPKDKEEQKLVLRGKGQAPKKGNPNSVYEKIDNENPNLVTSRTTYDQNGYPATREDYYVGSNPRTHYDKTTNIELKNHKHIFEYNEKGLPIGEKVIPL